MNIYNLNVLQKPATRCCGLRPITANVGISDVLEWSRKDDPCQLTTVPMRGCSGTQLHKVLQEILHAPTVAAFTKTVC